VGSRPPTRGPHLERRSTCMPHSWTAPGGPRRQRGGRKTSSARVPVSGLTQDQGSATRSPRAPYCTPGRRPSASAPVRMWTGAPGCPTAQLRARRPAVDEARRRLRIPRRGCEGPGVPNAREGAKARKLRAPRRIRRSADPAPLGQQRTPKHARLAGRQRRLLRRGWRTSTGRLRFRQGASPGRITGRCQASPAPPRRRRGRPECRCRPTRGRRPASYSRRCAERPS
jgi:hypothetical protein